MTVPYLSSQLYYNLLDKSMYTWRKLRKWAKAAHRQANGSVDTETAKFLGATKQRYSWWPFPLLQPLHLGCFIKCLGTAKASYQAQHLSPFPCSSGIRANDLETKHNNFPRQIHLPRVSSATSSISRCVIAFQGMVLTWFGDSCPCGLAHVSSFPAHLLPCWRRPNRCPHPLPFSICPLL